MSQVGNPEGEDKPNKKVRYSYYQDIFLFYLLIVDHSTMILVFGSVRVKRPYLSVSRSPAQISETSVSIAFSFDHLICVEHINFL